MRRLSLIPGLLILIFLVTAVNYYKNTFEGFLIAIGAVITTICLIIIQIPKLEKKEKKKGYILRG
jgi:hypothetical protein